MSVSLREQHATEEQLLRALDSELLREERAAVEEHVASCWGCRHKQEQLRKTMDRFAEFETVLAESGEIEPPGEWREFPIRLRVARSVLGPARVGVTWRMRSAAAVLSAVSVGVSALWLWPTQTVSAKEILDLSAKQESRAIRAVAKPVVKQRVRVESARGMAEGSFWHTAEEGKTRREWSRGGAELTGDVERFYASHGLNLKQPVSAANHAAWRGESRVEDMGDRLRIVSRKGSEEAELVVRSADWHPVEQSFSVNGAQQFRVIETGFEVVGMTPEMAKLFGPVAQQPETIVELGAPKLELPVMPMTPSEQASAPQVVTPQELMEAEVAALWTLRRAGAGKVDAARVSRTATSVDVTVYGSDAALTNALRGLPHVRVLTPAEGEPQGEPQDHVSAERAEQPLFLHELVSLTGSLSGANALASQPLALLRRLQVELAAMRHLELRFPADVRLALSAEAREQLDALTREHFESAQALWKQTSASSALLLSAMGAGAPEAEGCRVRESAQDLLFAARRMEELYARAFTAVAGVDAPLRWMTKGALREEAVSLLAVLSESFAENCR